MALYNHTQFPSMNYLNAPVIPTQFTKTPSALHVNCEQYQGVNSFSERYVLFQRYPQRVQCHSVSMSRNIIKSTECCTELSHVDTVKSSGWISKIVAEFRDYRTWLRAQKPSAISPCTVLPLSSSVVWLRKSRGSCYLLSYHCW